MTEYANWTHNPETDTIPRPHPHTGTYTERTNNQSGRTVYFRNRDVWIATDTHLEVKP